LEEEDLIVLGDIEEFSEILLSLFSDLDELL